MTTVKLAFLSLVAKALRIQFKVDGLPYGARRPADEIDYDRCVSNYAAKSPLSPGGAPDAPEGDPVPTPPWGGPPRPFGEREQFLALWHALDQIHYRLSRRVLVAKVNYEDGSCIAIRGMDQPEMVDWIKDHAPPEDPEPRMIKDKDGWLVPNPKSKFWDGFI